MSTETEQQGVATPSVDIEEHPGNEVGFKFFLYDLADELFPFPGYRDYQDEILYRALTALYVDGKENVIIDGPTGIGKSPINVTIGRVNSYLYQHRREIREHFGVTLQGINTGKSFYTTPLKQLRNQLANDDTLRQYVQMLKSRQDYICGVSGENCAECDVRFDPDPEVSCRSQAGCTYWRKKVTAMDAEIAVITFAMMIIDSGIPPTDMDGRKLSFDNRDVVIVDEAQNLESQAASLFAGFDVSPWVLPNEVFGKTGDKVGWNVNRFEQVRDLLDDVALRARRHADRHENNPARQDEVEQCENFLRKYDYCVSEIKRDRPWVVNISKVRWPGKKKETKKIELKPVDVDRFLRRFIWSRGSKRVISSATIPYRSNIDKWAQRLGLDGETELISKPMPFPREHRLIHTNTVVGSMSGGNEDEIWPQVVDQLREIHSHHEGERGLIHTASFNRAEKVADALGDVVLVHEQGQDKEKLIEEWIESDRDVLVSPSMMEGVDLYGDRCRWQVLLKVPFGYAGDSRVSFLLNERRDWTWYYETTSCDVQQSVGRAVRGPESFEAASFYVIDEKFGDVVTRTAPPDWFTEAITDQAPEHWEDEQAAPWRNDDDHD